MITKNNQKFSPDTIELALKLHAQLTIDNYDWHKHKNNSSRRAAELISASLVQLINEGENTDIENQLKQAIKWIKNQIQDPGCSR
tara:strand:- start:473 stop:727 length:255 start_codon:yes stop_codon:yes gene_type:complete